MDRLGSVLDRIGGACRRSGREPSSVFLVAVTKSFGSDRVRALLDRGHVLFGENRIQEALPKMDEVGPPARWHFIGHLQRNKARHAVGRFDLIHSLDGEPLARELSRRAEKAGILQPVLLQVNQAGEETKAGVAPGEVQALASIVAALPCLELRGLMTVPPPAETPEDSRHWFRELREIRDDVARRLGRELPDLSMGMTDDFEVAVEEGATLVRVGRALFGERPTGN